MSPSFSSSIPPLFDFYLYSDSEGTQASTLWRVSSWSSSCEVHYMYVGVVNVTYCQC
jgi:hypothetical protein